MIEVNNTEALAGKEIKLRVGDGGFVYMQPSSITVGDLSIAVPYQAEAFLPESYTGTKSAFVMAVVDQAYFTLSTKYRLDNSLTFDTVGEYQAYLEHNKVIEEYAQLSPLELIEYQCNPCVLDLALCLDVEGTIIEVKIPSVYRSLSETDVDLYRAGVAPDRIYKTADEAIAGIADYQPKDLVIFAVPDSEITATKNRLIMRSNSQYTYLNIKVIESSGRTLIAVQFKKDADIAPQLISILYTQGVYLVRPSGKV